jgi:hypothetical membrane protein
LLYRRLDDRFPEPEEGGIFLFLGSAQFAFFLALAEIYYPGYSVSTNAISDLGATCKNGACEFVQPSSEMFNSSISLQGLLVVCGSHYLWKGYRSKALAFFLALAGVARWLGSGSSMKASG